jgi:hypothetical protein
VTAPAALDASIAAIAGASDAVASRKRSVIMDRPQQAQKETPINPASVDAVITVGRDVPRDRESEILRYER